MRRTVFKTHRHKPLSYEERFLLAAMRKDKKELEYHAIGDVVTFAGGSHTQSLTATLKLKRAGYIEQSNSRRANAAEE